VRLVKYMRDLWTALLVAVGVVALTRGTSLGAGVPKGKGITVPGPPGAHQSRWRNPDAFADELARLGVQWCALPGEHFSGQSRAPESWYDANLKAYGEALRKRGIAVSIFGYVYPGDGEMRDGNRQPTVERQMSRLLRSARLAGASNIRFNCESQWRAPRGSARFEVYSEIARAMVAEAKAAGYTTTCSSYGGGPRFFSNDFPWEAWATCDNGSPQLYSQEGREAREARRESWRSAGFRELDPTVGLGDAEPEQMLEEAQDTPYDNNLAFWSWYLIDRDDPMREAYGRVRVPPGGQAVIQENA